MNDNINNPPVGSIDTTSLNTEYNVDVEVVYLTIPTKWIPTYRKLLSLIANGGKAILDDCNYGCKGNGSVVFNCWNIFQSACAAHAEGKEDEAELFINYVSKQINAYNKSNGIKVNDTGFKYTITPDGKIKFVTNNPGLVADAAKTVKNKEFRDAIKRIKGN